MFKQLLAMSLLSCSVASAQMVSSVKEAQEQAAVKCSEGCLVLSPSEIAAIEETMQKAIQEAYQAGLRGWSKVALQKTNK
tara:strand:+ start:190 stop:429 length:240 start_codon:yes stop_codon:yes gene_type:complete